MGCVVAGYGESYRSGLLALLADTEKRVKRAITSEEGTNEIRRRKLDESSARLDRLRTALDDGAGPYR